MSLEVVCRNLPVACKKQPGRELEREGGRETTRHSRGGLARSNSESSVRNNKEEVEDEGRRRESLGK